MLLKALKIAPLLLGLNSPSLEQPKKASIDQQNIAYYYSSNQSYTTYGNMVTKYQISTAIEQQNNSFLNTQSYFFSATTYQTIMDVDYTIIDSTVDGYNVTPFAMYVIEITPTAEGMKTLENIITTLYEGYTRNTTVSVTAYLSYNQNLSNIMTLPSVNNNDYLEQYKKRESILSAIRPTANLSEVDTELTSVGNHLITNFNDNDVLIDETYNIANEQKTYLVIDEHISSSVTLNINDNIFILPKTYPTPNENKESLELKFVNTNYTGQSLEVVDVGGLMFEVLTMPFTFISVAFNLTMFAGTPYQINISNLFLSIIALLIFGLIIKIVLGFKK